MIAKPLARRSLTRTGPAAGRFARPMYATAVAARIEARAGTAASHRVRVTALGHFLPRREGADQPADLRAADLRAAARTFSACLRLASSTRRPRMAIAPVP